MYKKLEINPHELFYHGTDAVFDRFEDQFKGSHTGWDNTIHGFFFTDKKENALLFGDTIIEARLTVSNPMDFRLTAIFNDRSQASLIWEILSGEKLSGIKALYTINRVIGLGDFMDMHKALNSENCKKLLVEAGHDGIISSLGNGEVEYIVFKPSQIEIIEMNRSVSPGLSR